MTGEPEAGRSSRRLAALVVTAAISLTGCTAQEKDLPIELPPKNIDQWVTPLDQYVPDHEFMRVTGYAEAILATRCVRDRGFNPAEMPWRDLRVDNGPSWNEADRALFTVELAQQYGYHFAPTSEQPNPEWDAFIVADNAASDAETDAYFSCLEVVRAEQLQEPREGFNNVATGYISLAGDKARQDPEVGAARSRWVQCMAGEGIPDLPDDPSGMPSESLDARFGFVDPFVGTASRDEIAVATQDAICRKLSGFDQAMYDAEWDAAVEQLREHADELERLERDLDDYFERCLEVLGEYAPSVIE